MLLFLTTNMAAVTSLANQQYVAVLKFGSEIQNSGGNVVSFSKINKCEISF